MVNHAASYWGAVGVESVAKSVFPKLSRYRGVSRFFTAVTAPSLPRGMILRRFYQTMAFDVLMTLVYGGRSVFPFFQSEERATTYLGRFWAEGFIGVIRLMGERSSDEVELLVGAKRWLRSRPLTRMTGVEGAWGIPERFLDFFGRVTPSEEAKFAGLAAEIGANTLTGFVEARLFGAPFNLSTLTQSGIINLLGSYANVCVTQHSDFSIGEVWLWRAVIGIAKGSIYRGICATPSVTTAASFLIQSLAGLSFITLADHLTRDQSS